MRVNAAKLAFNDDSSCEDCLLQWTATPTTTSRVALSQLPHSILVTPRRIGFMTFSSRVFLFRYRLHRRRRMTRWLTASHAKITGTIFEFTRGTFWIHGFAIPHAVLRDRRAQLQERRLIKNFNRSSSPNHLAFSTRPAIMSPIASAFRAGYRSTVHGKLRRFRLISGVFVSLLVRMSMDTPPLTPLIFSSELFVSDFRGTDLIDVIREIVQIRPICLVIGSNSYIALTYTTPFVGCSSTCNSSTRC